MKAEPIPCGPAVTESERQALERVKAGLISLPGDDCWYVLTNLMFSVTHQLQSDEIDMVAIGPPGVRVVEVKHWADAHAHLAEREADRVTVKARKIGTTLRKLAPNLPRVDGVVLLTRPRSKAKRLTSGGPVRGVHFHPLKEWRAALRPDERAALSPQEVRRLVKELAPSIAVDGVLRRLAGYVNLELQTAEDERFHRIYKGTHSSRKDRVFLHLYDLSADMAGGAEEVARREHDVLHFQLSRFGWAPRVLDSFQDVPGHTGEMKFFTVMDPAVPSIEERSRDDSWSIAERIDFARQAVHAVQQLHEVTADELGLVHRNLSPRTILVKHDNSPVLTGFEHVGTPVAHSASLAGYSIGEHDDVVAPEVREHGLSAADQASDVYSLCASLRALFGDWEEDDDAMLVQKANQALEGGLGDPRSRPSLENLASVLEQLLETGSPEPTVPAARFWTEDQQVRFENRTYRIVDRLGSGGVGTAFKVVELDPSTKRDVGTFLGKVVSDEATGEQVRQAYQRARLSVSRHPGLSAIFQVASEWRENEFVALTTWIEGSALADYAGVIAKLDEPDQPDTTEESVLHWLEEVCLALDKLHRNGLIHGDVSPGNIIVAKAQDPGQLERSTHRLVLTDYDFVTRVGELLSAPGAVLYGSPNRISKGTARPSDDLFALAASFFHVLFDKKPFVHGGRQEKKRGLNWEHGDRDAYPRVAEFMDRATDPDSERRFASVAQALQALRAPPSTETTSSSSTGGFFCKISGIFFKLRATCARLGALDVAGVTRKQTAALRKGMVPRVQSRSRPVVSGGDGQAGPGAVASIPTRIHSLFSKATKAWFRRRQREIDRGRDSVWGGVTTAEHTARVWKRRKFPQAPWAAWVKALGPDRHQFATREEATAWVTAAISGKKLPVAVEVEKVGAKVAKRPPESTVVLGVDRLAGDRRVTWNLTVKGNPHLLVAGLPGMGKTTCLLNLCRQMLDHGVRPIVFSYHQDLDEKLSAMIDPIRFIDFDGLGFNPLHVHDRSIHRPHLEVAGVLRDIFMAIYPGLGELQGEAIRSAVKECFAEAGWGEPGADPAELPDPPFKRFFEVLASREDPDRGHRNLQVRLEELNDYGFFDAGKAHGSLWESEEPTVIRIHRTQSDVLQKAFSSLVLYGLYKDMFRRGIQDRITHAVVFDEAHRAAKLGVVPTMAKECRKYGVSLVLASQEARDFHKSVFSAVANYLALRLTDADAKALVRNVADSRQEKALIDAIKQMKRFRALYFREGKTRPDHVDLMNYTERL